MVPTNSKRKENKYSYRMAVAYANNEGQSIRWWNLADDSNMLTKEVAIIRLDVMAINKNSARTGLIHPLQERDSRGFSTTTVSHQRERVALGDLSSHSIWDNVTHIEWPASNDEVFCEQNTA